MNVYIWHPLLSILLQRSQVTTCVMDLWDSTPNHHGNSLKAWSRFFPQLMTWTQQWCQNESHRRNPNFLPFQKCSPFSFGFHRNVLTIGCFSNFRHWTREASLRSCSTPRRCVLLIRLLKGYALTGMDTPSVVGLWKFVKGWSYTEGFRGENGHWICLWIQEI